jgi:hypothetical protein
MAGVRIRWRGVARVAAIVVVGLVVLRLLPGLLRAPEPPPLAADVGLPKAVEPEPVEVEPTPVEPAAKRRPRRHRERPHQKARPRVAPDAPASTAVIGTHHRHRKAQKSTRPRPHQGIALESPAPPAPEYVAEPPPEPTLEPPPAVVPAPPPPPGDGSEEFAPH